RAACGGSTDVAQCWAVRACRYLESARRQVGRSPYRISNVRVVARARIRRHDLAEVERATHAARPRVPGDDRVELETRSTLARVRGRLVAVHGGNGSTLWLERRKRLGRAHEPEQVDRCCTDVSVAASRSLWLVVSRRGRVQRGAGDHLARAPSG